MDRPQYEYAYNHRVDIVYSYYEGGDTADASRWTNFIPITFAPFDNRINNKFGFAMAPFRDAEGNPIPAGEDIGGSYPWMDRDAKNLFLETIGERSKLYYHNSNFMLSRYPAHVIPGDMNTLFEGDTGGKHQAVSLIGLWTHGKLVQFDNLNNDVDFAVGKGPNPQTRDVELFDATTDPVSANRDKLRLGYGRASSKMPHGENDNGNIIDSLEARFNYRKHFKPIGLRDVVWPLTNGKHTDELAFDDYLDPDAFIVANMTGLLTWLENPHNGSNHLNILEHHDGWVHPNGPFSNPVKLQNAATTELWSVPAHGLVKGPGRLEPAATGGVNGKGFWMDGTIGLEFQVPQQSPPGRIQESDWYVGLFVDSRFDDTNERRLISFPDGSEIRLYGRRQVLYLDAGGSILHRVTIPLTLMSAPTHALDDLLPKRGWAHLAFQIQRGGSQVDFHLDGLLFDRYRNPDVSLFQLDAGVLTVGHVQGSSPSGFHGWIDDFKVFAHKVDLETACNHAGGTLIALEPSYSGEWLTHFADRFPTWIHEEISATLRNHGEPTYQRYANYHNYQMDNGVHLGNIPAGAQSMRASVHFPEGPLYHNAPRPHSVQNEFCISCHHPAGKPGLDLNAITLNTFYNASSDPRRQPSQPDALLHGFLPEGLVDTVSPPMPPVGGDTIAPPDGFHIDEWMLPERTGPSQVVSLTLVHPDTGNDLYELTPNMIVDLAAKELKRITIRANLDSAQGSVTLDLNGQVIDTTEMPPHVLANVELNPGTHTILAKPDGGTPYSLSFEVPRTDSERIVAGYRSDFRPGSPAPGWSYVWNANGPYTDPTNYRSMNWSPLANRYNVKGLGHPDTSTFLAYGHFRSTGGHPGRGASTPGNGIDRYALAGFEVQGSGTYKIKNGYVTQNSPNGNGGRVVILVRTGNTVSQAYTATYSPASTHNIPEITLSGLSPGQIIYVGVGPEGTDTSDGFSIDYEISFHQ